MAYTINQGDTLSKIAAANKTTVQDIMKANPNITDPNKIQAGGSLNLPSLAQSNGVRANFPSTPAPTNTAIKPSQAMPGTGNANTNAATTNNILFGNKNTSVTPSFGTGSPSANAARTATTLTSPQWQKDLSGYLAGVQKGPTASSIPPTGSSVQSPLKQASTANVGPSTTTSTANTEASSAGSKVGNTFVMQNGTVIDANTGKVISGPTSSQSVTYTPPASTPDGKTTPTGQAGYTDNAPKQDMSYGGLIQQSLQQQIDSANRIADIQNKVRQATANEYSSPDTYTFKVGHAKNIADYGAQQVANEQARLANIGNIYGKAITATAPQLQFGQLTDPRTGLPMSGGAYGSNPQLQNAVGLALQMVASGADPKDSQVQNLISTFGMPGQALFTQGMNSIANGTYNPTAFSASAQSAASQGAGYKESAVALDTALRQIEPAGAMAVDFLNKVQAINPSDSSILNVPVNKYIGDVKYSGAVSQYSAILGDIKKFTSQILSSNSGTIPTDVTNTLATFDPTNLSASQLKPYLDTLKELGQNQLAIMQEQTSNLGVGGYVGGPASITTSTTPAPAAQNVVAGIDNPVAQGVAGFGMKYIPTIVDKLVSFMGGAATALASKGLAGKVLK